MFLSLSLLTGAYSLIYHLDQNLRILSNLLSSDVVRRNRYFVRRRPTKSDISSDVVRRNVYFVRRSSDVVGRIPGRARSSSDVVRRRQTKHRFCTSAYSRGTSYRLLRQPMTLVPRCIAYYSASTRIWYNSCQLDCTSGTALDLAPDPMCILYGRVPTCTRYFSAVLRCTRPNHSSRGYDRHPV